MQQEPLHIVPASGFSKEIAALGKALGYRDFHFYDDNPKVAPSPQTIPKGSKIALASGSGKLRKTLALQFEDYQFPSLIHPEAILMEAESITLGKGAIITAGTILTTNIEMGAFPLINLHCSIGHDCKIGNFCSLMPGVRLSGGVQLEDGVYIGSNTVVLPNIKIGAHAVIGAGSVVTRDISAGKTYVGVPAKEISKMDE